MYRKTYVKVDLDCIEKNVKNILKKYNNYKYYFGVVKGNAYGHGFGVVNTMINNGINYLAVSNLNEALEIRKYHTEIPILCLQPINVEFLNICSDNNITITVSSENYVEKIKNLDLELKIHIKIDSGMNRLGFDESQSLKKSIDVLKNNKNFYIEGIYTHMGTLGISDPYWDKQLSEFKNITKLINLDEFSIVHIDRSVTMMCHPKIDFCNGVRIGISLYGYDQLPKQGKGIKSKIRQIKSKFRIKKLKISETNIENNLILEPALSLSSEVIEIKNVNKGEFVGYFGYINNKESIRVATVEIGYADGVDLRSNGGFVSINEKKYQIIGTINMGMISVKVDDSVNVGDKVELIGKNISIREVSAKLNNTIYETMTTISPLLPRVYIKDGIKINTKEGK